MSGGPSPSQMRRLRRRRSTTSGSMCRSTAARGARSQRRRQVTLLLSIMGYTEVSRGPGVVARKDITGMQPHRRARAGLGWVAQEREIFPSLTVEENLTVASRPGRWDLHAVYGLFPRLAERRANMGNQLSGGEQQMLAVARTLMTNPALLLLDEPLEGLAPIIVEELLGVLGNVIRKEGLSAIIVEQKAHKILRFTDRAIILDRGRIVFSGDSAALAADPEVLETHLGVAEQKKGGLSPPLPH